MIDNIKTDKAFIASNKYIVRETNSAGTGVIVSYDEDIEKKESARPSGIKSDNFWFDILIPSEEYLLDLAKPLEEQSIIVRAAFHNTAANLQTLFYGEALAMGKRLESYLNTVPEDEKYEVYQKEMNYFYEKKYNFLKDLKDGKELIEFITSCTKTKDVLIAVSFLSNQCGIYGSKYKDNLGERVMIYDAQSNIAVSELHRQELINAKIIA